MAVSNNSFKSRRSGVAIASTIALALGGAALVAPSSAAAENVRYTDTQEPVEPKQSELNSTALTCGVRLSDTVSSNSGLSYERRVPGMANGTDRNFGLQVTADTSGERTFNFLNVVDGPINPPISSRTVTLPPLQPGDTIGPSATGTVNYVKDVPDMVIKPPARGQTAREFRTNMDLTEGQVDQIVNGGMTIGWKDQYNDDWNANYGYFFSKSGKFLVNGVVNPWPSENADCSPITIEWAEQLDNDKDNYEATVINPGVEVKVGTVSADDDSLERLRFIAKDPKGNEVPGEITREGNDVYWTMAEYRDGAPAYTKTDEITFEMIALPRDLEGLQKAAGENGSLPETVFDSSLAPERYRSAETIATKTFDIDDAKNHDPNYDSRQENITSGVANNAPTGGRQTRTFTNVGDSNGDTLADLVEKYNARIELDDSNVYEGWDAYFRDPENGDYTVVVESPAGTEARPGSFGQPVVKVTYSNGTQDIIPLLVIVDPNNTQTTDVVYPPETIRGLIGEQMTSAAPTLKRVIGKNQKPVKPASYTVDPATVPAGWTIKVAPDGTVTATSPAAAKAGDMARPTITATYPDGTVDKPELTFLVGDDASLNSPLYPVEVTKPGTSVTHQIQDVPGGVTFTLDNDVVDGWTYSVDPNTGAVTVTPPADAKGGDEQTNTVTVTYPDGTKDVVPVNTVVAYSNSYEAEPHYPEETAYPGEQVESPLSVDKPEEVGFAAENPFAIVPGTNFTATGKDNEFGNPTYKVATANGEWTVSLDAEGNVLSQIPDTAEDGDSISVEVEVTYEDGSTDKATAVVNVKQATRPIPFGVEYKFDPALPAGTYEVETEGVAGEEKQQSDGTWKRTKEPTNEVVRVGTKQASASESVEWIQLIPYSTIVRPNPKLAPGQTKVVQIGEYGIAGYKATFTGTNGEASVEETQARQEPTDQIIEYGPRLDDQELVTETTRRIPFDTKIVYDDTLEAGTQVVEQQGVVGEEKVTSTQKLVDGKPAGDPVVKTTQVTPKQDAVIRVGTKKPENATPEGTFIPPLIKHVATESGTVKFTPEYPNNMVPGSIRFLDGNKNEVNELKVLDQGTWRVDSNGEVTFKPEDGFTGNPTPVSYVATTTTGVKAAVDNPGKFAVVYQLPTATTVTETTQVPTTVTTTAAGTPTTITTTVPTTITTTNNVFALSNVEKVADKAGKVVFTPRYANNIDTESIRFLNGNEEVNVLVVLDEGTWTVNEQGRMTFTPEDGFTGDPTPVKYIASTKSGVKAAEPAEVSVKYQLPVTQTTTATTTDVRTETVTSKVPTTVTETEEVPTTVNGTPTTVTETKEVPTTVTTQVPTTVTEVSKFYIPPVLEHVSNKPGEVKFTPKYLETMVPGTIQFLDGNKNLTKTLTIDGQGTWTVKDNGEITFTPIDSFKGDPTPVLYVAERVDGTKARIEEPGTVAVRYQMPDTTTATTTATTQVPTTVRETATATTTIDGTPTTVTQTNTVFIAPKLEHVTSQAGEVVFTPDYPANMKPGSVKFLDGDKNEVDTLVVQGQGTWTVGKNGGITFEPADGYTGDPTPVAYVATTNDGVKSSVDNPGKIALRYQLPTTMTVTTAVPTTVVNTTTVKGTPTTITETTQVPTTITTTAKAFTLPDAQKVATVSGPVRVEPNYPAGIDFNSVELIDRNGNKAQNVDVAGEGTWSVDRNTGFITFTPVDGFTGDPTPIAYTAKTADGVVASNNGRIRVSYQLPVTATVTTAVPTTVTETVETTTTVDGTPTTITETKEVPTTVPTTVVTTVPTTVTNTVLNLPNIEKTARKAGAFEFTPRYGRSVDPETVRFIDAEGNRVNVLEVKGNGTWTVDRDGKVKFTPENGFTGSPVKVSYIASTRDGVEAAAPASMTLEYELPVTETQTATESTTVRDTVWVEKPTTIVSEIPTTVVTEVPTTVTTEIPTTVTTAVPTTVNVFVLSDLKHVAREAGRQEFTPRYPSQVDRATVRFVDRRGQETQVLNVEGQGTWTVDREGKITFTPVAGFTSNPMSVPYIASTSNGVKAAETADISIFYELPSTEVVTTTETTERLVTTTVPTEVTTTVPTTVTTQVPTTITTVIPTTVTSNVPTTIPTTVTTQVPTAPTETTPTVVKPGASSDGSSAQAKSVVERCFGNAVRSPILWLLPIGILGAVGGKVLEPYMASINQEFGALNAEINRRVQQAMPDFGFGGHGGNNEQINQLMAQVDAANRQLQAFAGQPGVQQIGQAIGVIAALAALSGVLYDWCSADVGQAKTAIDFGEGSSSRR